MFPFLEYILFFSLFEYILPVKLIIKCVIIIVIALMTVIGAYLAKSKISILVIFGGIAAILIVWFVDFEVSL